MKQARAAELGVHNMQQQEALPHFLVSALRLLLYFAAMQASLPVGDQTTIEWPTIEMCVDVASTAVSLPQTNPAGPYLSGPADLQHALMPMMEQINSAVLGFPGLAAYRRSGSGSMPSSTLTRPDMQYAVSSKMEIAGSVIAIIRRAAGFRHGDRPGSMPAATLSLHVLMVGQLCEAAVRLSLQDAPTTVFARYKACAALSQLSSILRGLSGMVGELFGAVLELEAAGNVAAAEAAFISVENAMSQIDGLCCSILKAASTASAAATPPADYAYF
jgi:hypothetical protein